MDNIDTVLFLSFNYIMMHARIVIKINIRCYIYALEMKLNG